MEYIVTGNEMKMYDKNTIEQYGVNSLVLMERAAVSVCECILQKEHIQKVLVLCGPGNNGGDGFAVARILHTKGYEVSILFTGKKEKMTKDTKIQYEIVTNYGIKTEYAAEGLSIFEEKFDCIVDALFGVSLNRNIEGFFKEVIDKANETEGCFKIAVDLPSGISSDTGLVMGSAFIAHETVTFAYKKAGLYLGDAKDYCGKVILKDIGITDESFLSRQPKWFSYSLDDLKIIPKRKQTANKGSFGKLLVIAGSRDMMGAALLCSMSAYRSGCGYVRVLTEKSNKEAIVSKLPEAVISTYEEGALDTEVVKQACDFATAIVIGPGLSMSDTAGKIVEYVLKETSKPLVVDADAINLISKSDGLRQLLLERKSDFPVIFTPHLLELSRFMNVSIPEIKKELPATILETADKYNMVLVCKDATTVVCHKGQYYLNQTGNDGLATAGSGDVLAGMIGSLLAKGMDAMQAACIGVFVHGLCGDYAAKETGRSYLKAGDLIEQLRYILE